MLYRGRSRRGRLTEMMGVVTSRVAALIFVERHGGHDRADAAEKGRGVEEASAEEVKACE